MKLHETDASAESVRIARPHGRAMPAGRRDEQGRCRGIALSTLDFEGELIVTKPEILLPALLNGIGPAKSFGCGLLLVRHI